MKPPPEPFAWRVQGRAADGCLVTLGKYVSAEAAQADCQRLAAEGYYRKVEVVAIPAPAAGPVGPAGSAPDPPPISQTGR